MVSRRITQDLERDAGQSACSIENPDAGRRGEITALQTFDWQGYPCRQVRVINEGDGRTFSKSLYASKVDVKWKLVALWQLGKGVHGTQPLPVSESADRHSFCLPPCSWRRLQSVQSYSCGRCRHRGQCASMPLMQAILSLLETVADLRFLRRNRGRRNIAIIVRVITAVGIYGIYVGGIVPGARR